MKLAQKVRKDGSLGSSNPKTSPREISPLLAAAMDRASMADVRIVEYDVWNDMGRRESHPDSGIAARGLELSES